MATSATSRAQIARLEHEVEAHGCHAASCDFCRDIAECVDAPARVLATARPANDTGRPETLESVFGESLWCY